jgi:hypothetical protein
MRSLNSEKVEEDLNLPQEDELKLPSDFKKIEMREDVRALEQKTIADQKWFLIEFALGTKVTTGWIKASELAEQ